MLLLQSCKIDQSSGAIGIRRRPANAFDGALAAEHFAPELCTKKAPQYQGSNFGAESLNTIEKLRKRVASESRLWSGMADSATRCHHQFATVAGLASASP